MRIAFVGLPLAALLLGDDGHDVVLAGLREGLTSGVRRLRNRLGDGRVVVDVHRDWAGFLAQARTGGCELLVSWFYTRRIPGFVLEAFPQGAIGVHPSLLPRHRGPDPFFAAIDQGDLVTGVTVHRLEEAYDTGAILEQRVVEIDPKWNAWNLARALDRPSLSALRDVVARMARGEALVAIEQNDQDATEAPFPGDDDREIVWDGPAERIVRRIRALAPSPGALAYTGDHEIVVTRAEVSHDAPRVLVPGEAAFVQGLAVVRTADLGVALLEGEWEGKRMSGMEIASLISRAGEQKMLS